MTHTDENRHLKSAEVRKMCGDVSDMTLWRWTREREFPKPIYIARRRYWREVDVVAWLKAQSNKIAA